MWIFLWIKLSWYSCFIWDKPGWLNRFWQFLCERYLTLIWKDSSAYAWSCKICKGRTSFCIGLISRKHCRFLLTAGIQLALLYSVPYFFFVYQSPSLSLWTVFDSISSNIDEVLLINLSANFFVFGEFNIHHKDWLTYSGGTDRSGELL